MKPAPNETQLTYHRRRLMDLKKVRTPWEATWQGLADFIAPQRLRLDNDAERHISRKKILNPYATFSWRTLKSGLHSGLTSPSRPWFRLQTPDPEMREWGPVKEWVDNVEAEQRRMFGRSNIYNAFHEGYGDIGLFGQSCGILTEGDNDHVLRMIQLLTGRYWLGRDENGRANTLYREMRWSVDKIVRRFGLANLSPAVRNAYDRSRYNDTFIICHAIEPREARNPDKLDKKNKAFLSNYWEDGQSDKTTMLEESGFDRNPIIAPPWEICGDDTYANSPGMDVIGDVKSLQAMTRDKLEAIAKMARPPMQGPTSMMGNPASLLPGALTFVDDPTGKGLRPVMEVNPRLGELMAEIQDCRHSIDTGMYADLFMMLQNMEGIQPRNVMEIAERKEEKLLQLGPVLENIYSSQLEPTIDMAFEIGVKKNRFPPPPPELEGVNLSVEYISTLAQAQKAVATGSIERVVGFAAQLAGVKPEVLDKIDGDQAIDAYAEMTGVPAAIIVTDDKVKAMRNARAKQQQQAQQAEMAAKTAPMVSAGSQAVQVAADAMNNPGGQQILEKLGIA